VAFEWRIVVEDCMLRGPDLLDLDLEVRDGELVIGPVDQNELFARLDELSERGCVIVAVSRHDL
jgi:hypothetical protein